MEAKRVLLNRRLRRENHKKIARLQDIVVEILYQELPRAVLHGGTAVWRCYSGNRFSEDIDAYIDRDTEKLDRLFRGLRRAGFEIAKRRTTQSALYSVLSLDRTEVRLEALFKRAEGVLRGYETYDGLLINVLTLAPEGLILEKIDAYLNRRKIRDLYDIFFLLRYAGDAKRLKPALTRLLREFKNPVDEPELKSVVLFGAVPTTQEMVAYLGRWGG